jgi:hypothetical protein
MTLKKRLPMIGRSLYGGGFANFDKKSWLPVVLSTLARH